MTDENDIPTDGPAGDEALAAELSLGLLTDEEHSLAARRARVDPAFAVLVNDWDIRLSAMADDIAPVAPPKGLFKRITNDAYPDSPKSIWRQLGVIPALICASLAAVVLGLTIQFGGLMQPPLMAPTFQARMVAEDDSMIVLAAFVPDNDTLFVEWQLGERLPDRDVELWLITGDDAPVSLGVLNKGTPITEVKVPGDLQDGLAQSVLAVSDEPLGGSMTGSPTGAILAIGEVSRL